MNNDRRIISVIVCGFIVTAAVHADMVPVCQQDAGRRQTQPVCDWINLYNKNVSSSFNFPGIAYLRPGFAQLKENRLYTLYEVMKNEE